MNSCKVLIVEDEVMLSDVYSTVLSKNNFSVEVAANGLEALEKLPTYKPDCILLDLMMPKMDGVTFLKTMNQDDKSKIKIIVYSNLFDGDTDKKVRHLGACEVVLKSSMTPDQLVELVDDHCS